MSQHFYPIRIQHIDRETPDAVRISFDIPEALKADFAYEAGQFITLRTHINGAEIRRTYSLCSSPMSGTWSVGIKEVPGGVFSTWANRQVQPGAVLDAMPPAGRFRLPAQAEGIAPQLIFFAAGSGITPVLSMLDTALRRFPQVHCSLVFANKNRRSIMFREDLEALKNKYLGRFQLIHILSREATDSALNHGRVDEAKCTALLEQVIKPNGEAAYFICGPEGFLQAVSHVLKAKAVPAHRIHHERFSAAAATAKTKMPEAAGTTQQPMARLNYTLDGIRAAIEMPYAGMSVLDAIREAGGDAPYACKGGVCCTCKAKVLEGKAAMDVVYGLEPDEVAAGYILTCQAHPTTEVLTISYDS